MVRAASACSIPLWAGKKQRPLIVEARGAREAASATEASLRRQVERTDRGKADPPRATRGRSEARRRRRASCRTGSSVDAGARELSDRLGSVRHRARGARHVLHRPPRGGRRASPASSAPRPTSASSPSTARGPPRWRLHPAPPSAPPHPGCRKDGHEITASHPSPPRRRPRRRASAGRRLPGWMHAQRSGHRRGDEVPVPHASPDHPRQARGVPDLRHEAGANRSGRAPTAAPNTAREGLAPLTIDAAKRQLLGLKTVAVQRAPFETSIRTTGPGSRGRAAGPPRPHALTKAFVEHVTADFTGKYVNEGRGRSPTALQPGALRDAAGVPPRSQGVAVARNVRGFLGRAGRPGPA